MSQLLASGGQSIGASVSTTVLPMYIQDWLPLELTGLISLLSKGLSSVFSNTTVQNINSLALSFLYSPTLTSYIILVQPLSRVRLFATPWITARLASRSITNSWSLLRLMCIKSVMPSSHLILCHRLLLLPPIPTSIRVFFQWVNTSHEVGKVLEFQLQHQSFQWTPRTDLL